MSLSQPTMSGFQKDDGKQRLRLVYNILVAKYLATTMLPKL